jgi:two-component system sensor histidine kinase/response regulator
MSTASILIVDDTLANLTLLAGFLKERGYRVRPVPSGDLALAAARADPPDLVLLDISMPEMDGFEVCIRFKAEPTLREIPIVFLTAQTDVGEKIRAFAAGGVDYVTKPFQAEEIFARIATHLELRQKQLELRERNKQLAAQEKIRDELVHMIVHDLRSPLAALCSLLEVLDADLGAVAIPDESRRDLVDCRGIAVKMIGMVTAVLDVNKLEASAMQLRLAPCDLAAIARAVVGEMRVLAAGHTVRVESAAPVSVVADEVVLGRVIENLLANALRFTPRGGEVAMRIERTEAGVRFAMTDDGKGIPEHARKHLFEKFAAADTDRSKGRYSTGLGLLFCRMAIEAHGGAIGAEARQDRTGSTFWFTLPTAA